MKITIIEPLDGEEDEVVIKCRGMDENTLSLIYNLKMQKQKITGFIDGSIHVVEPQEIHYFEAVDNKVFIYCKTKVYESKLKLYELEELFVHTDFFRASKSTILNLTYIKNLTPAFNGRLEALLSNGEKVIISRQYVPELKRKLGL